MEAEVEIEGTWKQKELSYIPSDANRDETSSKSRMDMIMTNLGVRYPEKKETYSSPPMKDYMFYFFDEDTRYKRMGYGYDFHNMFERIGFNPKGKVEGLDPTQIGALREKYKDKFEQDTYRYFLEFKRALFRSVILNDLKSKLNQIKRGEFGDIEPSTVMAEFAKQDFDQMTVTNIENLDIITDNV